MLAISLSELFKNGAQPEETSLHSITQGWQPILWGLEGGRGDNFIRCNPNVTQDWGGGRAKHKLQYVGYNEFLKIIIRQAPYSQKQPYFFVAMETK